MNVRGGARPSAASAWGSAAATGAAIFARCRCIRSLILINDKCRILLLGNAHIIARVILFHDVPGSRIQQYGVLIEFRQLGRTHAHQSDTVPFVVVVCANK